MPDNAAAFGETEVVIGPRTYRLRELSSGEYDDALNISTKENGDVDMVTMVKLMLVKGLVEPKLTDTQVNDLPYKVVRQLKRAISDLHWADDTDQAELSTDAESEEEPKNP